MSECRQKARVESDAKYNWQRFRRVCGLSALSKRTMSRTPDEPTDRNGGAPEDLHDDLRQQYDLQRYLAMEYANALAELRQTQERIDEGAHPALDARLEAQVLELAVCEEAYEIVCEEVEALRRELRQCKDRVE